MEKIFVRSKELEQMLDYERNLCQTKKERKAFRKYAGALERAECLKAVAPYITDSPEKYLRTLISLVNKLNQSDLPQAEEERLFQALSLFCVRPKLFFKSAADREGKNTAEHDVEKFEKDVGRFHRKWASFVTEIQLCKRYIHKGTRDLDRDATQIRKLNTTGEEQLAETLKNIYHAYYYELKAVGLDIVAELPSVDKKLLHNCLEKQWLLPLAHVILIRDAQCQMMGRKKYKKEALLLDDDIAKQLDISGLTEEKKYACGSLTYAYALEIQAALAKTLDGKLRSDYKNAFAHFFYEEYQTSKKENKEAMGKSSHLSVILGCSNISALRRFQDQMGELEKLNITPFAVPACHTEILALRIAAKLELSVEQLQVLTKKLPELFWSRTPLESWLNQLNIFDESEAADMNQKLNTLLSPVCVLLNPNEYFSAQNSEADLSAKLIRAAKALDPQIGGAGLSNNMKKLWSVFQDILYFCDLTKPALLLSGAIDAEYCPEYLMFDVTSYYIEKLYDQTKRYKKGKYKRQVLGLGSLTVDEKRKFTQLRINPEFDAPKRVITKQIIGVEDAQKMTLEMADKFWSRLEFSSNTSQSGFANKLITAVVKGSDNRVEAQKLYRLSTEEKGFMCLLVYTKLIDCSIAIIRKEVSKVLLKKSLELA